jgi:hypothetical protein
MSKADELVFGVSYRSIGQYKIVSEVSRVHSEIEVCKVWLLA